MKKYIPHVVAIVTFLMVTFAYLSPVLSGQRIFGHDTQSYVGMAKESADYNDSHSDQALWTDAMFGGMPTYQICMEQPTTLMTYLDKALRLLPDASYRVFLYLVGFYLLLIALGLNPYLAVACSIGFAFGSYNLIIIVAGHNTKAVAIAYMAPIIGAIWLGFRRNAWLGGALLALFLGLGLYANHVQITYYTLFIALCFGVSELVGVFRSKQWRAFALSVGALCLGAMLAVGLNATRLLTTAEYVKATMRGDSNGLTAEGSDQHGLDKEYITQWSYGIGESFTLLIPNYQGGASAGVLDETSHTAEAIGQMTRAPRLGRSLTQSEKQRIDKLVAADRFQPRNLAELMYTYRLPLYWGDQPFTAGPVYAGAIICFLFLLGLLIVPNQDRWWLLAAAVLGLVLSWGHNWMGLTSFFIDYVPLYGKFRTVSMTLTITCFAMATLAALALKALADDEVPTFVKSRAVLIAGGVTGGICLLFGALPSLAGDFVSPMDTSYTGQMAFLQETLVQDRMALLRSDAFRSLAMIAMAASLCWFYANRLIVKKVWVFAVCMGALLALDMIPIAARYLNKSSFVPNKSVTTSFQPNVADKAVLRDKEHVRTLNLNEDTFNSSRASYFYPTVGGYSAVKLRRYQELIDMQLGREIQTMAAEFPQVRTQVDVDRLFARMPVINMLNTRYVVYSSQAEPLYNVSAMGNAWLVRQVYSAPNADDEMAQLSEQNLYLTAVMDAQEAGKLTQQAFDPTGATIELTTYSPNKLEYSCHLPKGQLAVFSEIYYYKGWHAYIGGEEVPILRANWLLRACQLLEGDYTLTFQFEPQSYKIGSILALISSVLLTLAFSGIIFVALKKKKSDVNG